MPPGGEMRVRLDDRLGVAAVTYVLFGVKLGPALALSVILVFAVWIGWRWLRSRSRVSRSLWRAPTNGARKQQSGRRKQTGGRRRRHMPGRSLSPNWLEPMSTDEMIACLGSCRDRPELAALIADLSRHPWLNTPVETKRLEAARAAMANWKAYSHACQARHNAHRLRLSR